MVAQQTLIQDIFQKCLLKNLRITCIESCTGGMISSAITDVPGASKVFDKGLVTYSNESKIQILGVSRTSVEKYGAVSREVIGEMAQSLVKNERDKKYVTIATSGVAGPGQSEAKPVGLIWLASYRQNNILVRKLNLGTISRNEIRNKTVFEALQLLKKNLTF